MLLGLGQDPLLDRPRYIALRKPALAQVIRPWAGAAHAEWLYQAATLQVCPGQRELSRDQARTGGRELQRYIRGIRREALFIAGDVNAKCRAHALPAFLPAVHEYPVSLQNVLRLHELLAS